MSERGLAATGFDFAFAEGPARGLAYVFVDATAITVSASASTEARAVVFVAVFFSVLLDLEVPRLVVAAPSLALELPSFATGVFVARARETARRALDAAAMHL